jgi:hypothetical protein
MIKVWNNVGTDNRFAVVSSNTTSKAHELLIN